MSQSLLNLLKKSFQEFFKSPVLIAIGALFYLVLSGFSMLGNKIAPSLQTTFLNVIWVVTSVLLFLIFGGFISTLLIHLSQKKSALNDKTLAKTIKKSWLGSSLTLLMFLIFFNAINLILLLFTTFMLSIKNYITVSPETFRLLSIFISFVIVAGAIIFFSFTSFFVVLYKLPFFKAIRRSIRFVKSEYINSLLITVIFYAIITLINSLNNMYADIFNYAIILPFMFYLLTKFVLEFDAEKIETMQVKKKAK